LTEQGKRKQVSRGHSCILEETEGRGRVGHWSRQRDQPRKGENMKRNTRSRAYHRSSREGPFMLSLINPGLSHPSSPTGSRTNSAGSRHCLPLPRLCVGSWTHGSRWVVTPVSCLSCQRRWIGLSVLTARSAFGPLAEIRRLQSKLSPILRWIIWEDEAVDGVCCCSDGEGEEGCGMEKLAKGVPDLTVSLVLGRETRVRHGIVLYQLHVL
jgi:hypothetical protein